ncbi:hypothetical protein CDAR_433021 [Caerostris darwini]|uniref:Uncharacterized protein n=1 Tax=Caerostris darwini TaxID=1538125 RepID=A0AAV4QHH6_9ARAC|nr:hypothetical protein CDAR_433021 [Caerostris darwini]
MTSAEIFHFNPQNLLFNSQPFWTSKGSAISVPKTHCKLFPQNRKQQPNSEMPASKQRKKRSSRFAELQNNKIRDQFGSDGREI